MVATQPVSGVPAFVRYPTFPEFFDSAGKQTGHQVRPRPFVLRLFPRSIQRPNNPTQAQQELLDANSTWLRQSLSDRNQAGNFGTDGGYLVDQHGHFVFYQIHVNPAFVQFIQKEKLSTAAGIREINVDAPPVSSGGTPLQELTFLGTDDDIKAGSNTNIAEYKSAWMIVDKKKPPQNYYVVDARVPHYVVAGNTLAQKIVNGAPQFDDVKVALLALHVVFTLPGHPEMIWSTFEHVRETAKGEVVRDNAPALPTNPKFDRSPPDAEISPYDFILYKAHTPRSEANHAKDLSDIVQYWDEASQSFSKGGRIFQTSVYRPFPGSKTDKSCTAEHCEEDDEVVAINDNATEMFKDAQRRGLIKADDKRSNYRLVGAIWLDQPASGTSPSFTRNQKFEIAEEESTEDQGQALAGEARLGSTAMESFTEYDEGGSPNCFSCHDTSQIRHKGPVLNAARLNVSHVLSKFLIDQQAQPNAPQK